MARIIFFITVALVITIAGQCSLVFAADMQSSQAPQGKEAVIKDAGNTVCPVTGDPVNKDISYVYKGTRYYFCCPMCIEPFKNDPEKYIAKMNAAKK